MSTPDQPISGEQRALEVCLLDVYDSARHMIGQMSTAPNIEPPPAEESKTVSLNDISRTFAHWRYLSSAQREDLRRSTVSIGQLSAVNDSLVMRVARSASLLKTLTERIADVDIERGTKTTSEGAVYETMITQQNEFAQSLHTTSLMSPPSVTHTTMCTIDETTATTPTVCATVRRRLAEIDRRSLQTASTGETVGAVQSTTELVTIDEGQKEILRMV